MNYEPLSVCLSILKIVRLSIPLVRFSVPLLCIPPSPQVTGTPGLWDSGTPGQWDTRTMGHCDNWWAGVPTYRNHVVIFS